jgi:hypothetical protein
MEEIPKYEDIKKYEDDILKELNDAITNHDLNNKSFLLGRVAWMCESLESYILKNYVIKNRPKRNKNI